MRIAILGFIAFITLLAMPVVVVGGAPATREAKPWTRWWWPGNAVDKENLTRQLEAIAAAGFGGVEITPIYGIQGADDREIQFLSPRYIEMLAHVGGEAKRLDLGLDMCTGTGWPFGGPTVKPEGADAMLVRDAETVESRPTGMKVKRAAPGGAGLVLNPFSAGAMSNYLRWFDAPFAAFPKDLIRSQFHDSFEYSGNWHTTVPTRFRELHGYDLPPKRSAWDARVLHDYRATLDDLHLAYMRTWVEWCHKHGWKARNQAHGSPGNLLDFYAVADIPETETFGSTPFPIPGFRRDPADIGRDQPQPIMARFASSAAHVSGKPLVASETFTWLREHFRSSLSMMKPEVDQIFLCGINHVLFHGTCYSPADAAWPGWQFYASVEYAPQVPLWRDMPAMNQYITRVQAALQSGKPDNDVLLYWPIHDLWMRPGGTEIRFSMHRTDLLLESEFGRLARDLIARGYAVDFISDRQLLDCRRDGDAIVTGGGARYATLVVPKAEHIPDATRKKIDELSAGLPNVDDRRVRREAIAEKGIGYIRRARDDGSHVYFIANLTAKPFDEVVKLAALAKAVNLIDPLSGRSGAAAVSDAGVRVQLQPGESILVEALPAAPAGVAAWSYSEPAGDAIPLAGTWQVTFTEGGPTLPQPLTMETLKSWTDAGGDDVKNFSGAARYRVEFDAPAGDHVDWILDLGDVRESARVTLNGQAIGTLWSLPFRVRLGGGALKPGARNVLEIEVTNLAANRVADLDRRGVKWRIMKEINFVNIGYKTFDASKWAPAPSGLLGPVTLTPLRVTTAGANDQPNP